MYGFSNQSALGSVAKCSPGPSPGQQIMFAPFNKCDFFPAVKWNSSNRARGSAVMQDFLFATLGLACVL